MQNNAIYIYFINKLKNQLGDISKWQKNTFFCVLLQILFNYLKS
jgi:hypothetical protein